MNNQNEIYRKIQDIEKRILTFKKEPHFQIEINNRNSRVRAKDLSKNDILEIFASIVAFSQEANSAFVRDKLILTGDFKRIFKDFSVELVSQLDYESFMNSEWLKPLTYIGKKKKINKIIDFANKIKQDEELFEILRHPKIPSLIKREEQIQEFWRSLYVLQSILKEKEIAFLGSTTSLLHYLLEIGYDCIKPDSAVMEVANKIGIVENTKGDKNHKRAIDFLLLYAVRHNLRPSILDLYFLIAKPQEGAKQYVHPEFYPYPFSQSSTLT